MLGTKSPDKDTVTSPPLDDWSGPKSIKSSDAKPITESLVHWSLSLIAFTFFNWDVVITSQTEPAYPFIFALDVLLVN